METDRLSGKLAVILHADIAGSTALVQQDKELAHERIQDTFRRFTKTIENYQGQLLELRGDALLAEFEHVSDAVTAAISFQADHIYHISRLEDDLRPEIRVGIAMGEVVIADNTVTGAGVVQAQRVEQLADPGGVCITAAIQEALSKRLPFDLEDLGDKSLKGFEHLVRVYRVELSPGESIPLPEESSRQAAPPKTRRLMVAVIAIAMVVAGGATYWFKARAPQLEAASVERMAFPLPDKPSIAVLPFINISNDPGQEYFSDGITEDLITDLSKVPELFVISRNSTFTYKGRAVKVRQVAEELGVRYVLEGSVRRVGNQVRINAQLIDAMTGGHIWADRYDGSLTDIFALQDNVTEKIVAALALNLTDDQATKPPTANSQAYDLFLQGWAHYQRHTADDSAKAVPYFKAAIRLDSQYAQAHAALAAVYWETWDNRWTEALDISLSDAIKNAKQHLGEAMKEPTSLAHWVASNILIAEGNYETAVVEAKQIVSLDTNNAAGYAMLANALELSGQSGESATLIEKAVRLDPNASPLHAAAQSGDTNAVRQLIADGVHIDARDYYARTPLHVVAEYGHTKVATLLIAAGANIESKTVYARPEFRVETPLMIAARQGHTSVAELLISAGADVHARRVGGGSWTALFYAVDAGHTDVAKLLIANGADVDAMETGSYYTRQTPLFQAVMQGQKAMVELLISKGADVRAADVSGVSPLHIAARLGEFDITRLLLANGADVNTKTTSGDYPGETPLHAAAYSGHIQIAELLLTNGADINAANQYGYTPLRRNVDLGQIAMIELLIKQGADIATRDKYGITPLHVIAQTDNVTIAELLIAGGADINAKDDISGFTPMDYAQDGEDRMIETLKLHGAICTIC